MATDPRWSVRPRQRGRFGVPGLHLPNRPSAQEMAFDKIVVTVPGHLQSISGDPTSPSEVFDGYRQILLRRAEASEWIWSHPALARASFKTELTQSWGTISGAAIRARWADDVHELSLRLTLNPTRSLIHALAMVSDAEDANEAFAALHFRDFFASTTAVTTARTLDSSDNAFDHVDHLVERMGSDHGRRFISIFEEKLKQWALDAVAPLSEGFSWIDAEERLIADNVLLGPVGLLLGGLTGSKRNEERVKRLSLKLFTSDLHTPVTEVIFFDHPQGVKPDSLLVKTAAQQLDEWHGRFRTILQGNERATSPQRSSPPPQDEATQPASFGRRRGLIAQD